MSLTALSPAAFSPVFAPARAISAAPRETQDSTAAADGKLSPDEQRVVAQLAQRDRQVRTHEMMHIAAGGGLVRGGATYSFQRGPDGALYAVGGEVSIDTSSGRTPEETIERARQIRTAALAPADPSAQDRQVAATASQMESAARLELAASQSMAAASAEAPENRPGQIAGRNSLFGAGIEPTAIGKTIDTFA